MDRFGVIAVFFQRLGDHIDINLAVTKDDRVGTGVTFGIDDRTQHGPLFAAFIFAFGRFEHHHALGDVFARRRGAGHFDLGRVGQECIGDPFNFGRHGRAEKQRLPGERGQVEDAFDIRDEPHVEHPVSLVHDHDLHAGQQQFAALKMVEQPARRGNQHIDAPVDQQILFLETDPADQQRLGQFGMFGIGVKVFSHLCGKFAGRAQDQRPGHPRPGPAPPQQGDHRQHETGGLAGAGLRNAQYVAAQQRRGDSPRLNRGRRQIAGVDHRLKHLGVKVQVGKLHRTGVRGHGICQEKPFHCLRPDVAADEAARPAGLPGRMTWLCHMPGRGKGQGNHGFVIRGQRHAGPLEWC